jgi:hypothetical protein
MIGQNNSFFKSLIIDTFNSSKVARLNFKIGTTTNGEDGETLAIYQSVGQLSNNIRSFNITLDQNFLNNASNIEIALTLILESIHAELLERCIQLGLVQSIVGPNVLFYNNPILYTNNLDVFNQLILHYYNYNGTSNPQWNYDLFNAFGLRNKIQTNLLNLHNELNDVNNDFLTNVTNDPNSVSGPYSLNDLLYYLSWVGLEGTQAYLNTINNPTENNRMAYSEIVANTKYSKICNE